MWVSTALGTAVLASGLGLAVAPAANAATTIEKGPGTAAVTGWSATQGTVKGTSQGVPVTKGESRGRGPGAATAGKRAVSDSTLAADCWNGRTDGWRNLSMTCSGQDFRVFLDCRAGANYYRHFFPNRFWGTWDFTLTCPVGQYAVWGGSY